MLFPAAAVQLLETEGHAVIEKTQTGAALDDGIEVAAIVIQKPCQFAARQPTICIFQQTADTQKEQAFGAAAQVHRGDIEPGRQKIEQFAKCALQIIGGGGTGFVQDVGHAGDELLPGFEHYRCFPVWGKGPDIPFGGLVPDLPA